MQKHTLAISILMLLFDLLYHDIFHTAGFDFIGSHFVANFAANSTTATVDIPIVSDLISDEGTEYFAVQLSLRTRKIMSHPPINTFARIGSVPQATICIQDEIILDFSNRNIEVKEGENLTLKVTVSTASDQNFNLSVNITGNSAQCKL